MSLTSEAVMERVLQKVGLERCIEAFNNENITPDIVWKMSLYDMRCVGLSNRTEIMKLRTACVSYGSTKPIMEKGNFGVVPSYQIPKETLEILIKKKI